MPAPTKIQRKRYNRKRRNCLIEQGLCVTCGWRFVIPGRTQCQFCYDKWKKSAAKSDPDGEKRRERQRQRRQERIEAGLCTECGKPAIPGMRMCGRCRNMRNDSTRKYKIKQRTKKMMQGKVIPVLEEKGRHNKKEATR